MGVKVKPGYKQTEVGVIPEDWEVKRIGTIAAIFGGGTPSTTVSEYWDGQIPWVSAGDVSRSNGRYIRNTADSISKIGLASCSARIMPTGTTVIIARGATVGRMAQLGSAMAFNQTCYGLLPVGGTDQNYLYYAMLFSVNSMRALTYGTIFGTITTNSFEQWQIPFPPPHRTNRHRHRPLRRGLPGAAHRQEARHQAGGDAGAADREEAAAGVQWRVGDEKVGRLRLVLARS